jgi:hypothetical protein
VERWRARSEIQLAAELVDEQKRTDVPNAALHRREPDQLGVELVEHLSHVRLGKHGLEAELARREPALLHVLARCIHARRPRV